MSKKPDQRSEIADAVTHLLDRADAEIDRATLFGGLTISHDGKRYRDGVLETAIEATGNYIGSFAKLASAASDVLSMPYFSSRYCWDERKVSRSMHLRFSWDLFLHSLYNYREKKKWVLNQLKETSVRLRLDHDVNFGQELRAADKLFRKRMKERGSKLHEWQKDRREILIVEIHELGIQPDQPRAARDWYEEARSDMIDLMKMGGDEVVGDFHATIDKHQKVFADSIAIARMRRAELEDSGFNIEPNANPERDSIFGGLSFSRELLDATLLRRSTVRQR